MKIIRTIVGTLAVLAMVVAVGVPMTAHAADGSYTYGGGSVQSYAADQPLDVGSVVELNSKNDSEVQLSTKSNLQNMFGVVVDKQELPITLSSDGLKNETFVAVSGTYRVLVSNEGGDVKPGDYVTMSSVNGVAMKAGTEQKTVFGRANAQFDASSLVLSKTQLKQADGSVNKEVSIGMVPVSVNIQRNPNIKSTKSDLPDFLQRLGQAIAEKEVSPIRIYLSLAITAISLISGIIVLYSGVRNGIIAIGRNPMTKKSIFRALLEVILTSILILVIGLFAVYLLLRL